MRLLGGGAYYGQPICAIRCMFPTKCASAWPFVMRSISGRIGKNVFRKLTPRFYHKLCDPVLRLSRC